LSNFKCTRLIVLILPTLKLVINQLLNAAIDEHTENEPDSTAQLNIKTLGTTAAFLKREH